MRTIVKTIAAILIGSIIVLDALIFADYIYFKNHMVYEYDGSTNVTTTEIHHINGHVDYIYE